MVLAFGEHRLDIDRRELRRGGELVDLEPKTFDLLAYLVQNRDRVVDKGDLLKTVWGGRIVSDSALTTRINAVRRALGDNGSAQRLIRTFTGRGVRFIGDVVENADQRRPAEQTTVAAPTLVLPEKPSIAVLPFHTRSGDIEQDYFADGIVDDLITSLSRLRWLFVIARNSTFTYKGIAVDIRQVGRKLGVRYVVEGSVRRAGDQVRLTAQLIEADTGRHLWAERYDRNLTDVFELQDEIVSAIAGAIEPELLKFERERIAERPQLSEDAYDLYQRGMFHHYRQNEHDNMEAQRYFRRALAIDPESPQTMAALAIALVAAAYLGWAEDPERNYREAFDLSERSIALDSRYPNAHFALGFVCMWTRRSDRAIAAFQEAIKLNPSFAAAYVLLGWMHLYQGQPEEAIILVDKGIRLSPNDPRLFIWMPALAGAYYQLGEHNKAVEAGYRAWALKRNWPTGLRYVIAGLAQLGRLDEARALVPKLKLLNSSLAFVEGNLRRGYTDENAIQHILHGLRMAGFE